MNSGVSSGSEHRFKSRDARASLPLFHALVNFLKYLRASEPLSWSSLCTPTHQLPTPSLLLSIESRTLPFSSSNQTLSSVVLRK